MRSLRHRPPSGWDADGWHLPPWWDPEREQRRATDPRRRRFRLLFPVFLSLFVQLPNVFVRFQHGEGPVIQDSTPLDVVIAAVGPLALLAARRFPGPVVVVVAIAASIDLLLAGEADGPPYLAFVFALGSAIVRGARVWAWATIALTWVGTLVVAATLGITWQPWRIVGISLGMLVVVAIAESMRGRRERIRDLAARAIQRRQSEVQAERVRIARELHDVLAHSLSQINVQAGVGLHLLDRQPEKAREALASIKDSSKTALDEVRTVLGIMRAEGEAPLVPDPDLSRIEGLVAQMQAQGVSTEFTTSVGEVAKPLQLALYRITQESLTNVSRHAAARRVTVTLTEDADVYRLVIHDDGLGATEASEDGRGLLGMRERAELLGGSLEAGPAPEGGFRVIATIPREDRP